jgi:F-type H+-transporting ATPase subunit a
MNNKLYRLIFLALLLISFNASFAQHNAHAEAQEETHNEATATHENAAAQMEEEFNPSELINHHLADAHDYQFDLPFYHTTIHLPVILWTDNGLTVFSSGEFAGEAHGEAHGAHSGKIVEKNGQKFKMLHDLIVYADKVDEHAKPEEVTMDQRPLDFSITKNVFSMLLTMVALLIILLLVKKSYSDKGVPKGIAGFIEPLIVFIKDDVAKENIGPKYKKFVPFLLTVFFFILFSNLFGLIPFSPFGFNITGNILVTFVLAVIVFIITNVNGNKSYWTHILWPPGVPVILKPFIALIEILGIFTKPFALMIRLFANIFAGHTIILTFVSLIFVFKNWGVPFASGFATIFMYISELLVAFLQAYVFTLLSAIYFSMAVKEEAH